MTKTNHTIQTGYKDSEFGSIPSDWINTVFGEVLKGFSSGMTPYRGKPEYYTGNINWITSGELNYNLIEDTEEKITPKAVDETNLKILPRGTFLMAITGLEAAGTRGSCGIVGKEATTNQSCMALFSTEKITTEYLFHFYVRYGNELAFKYCQGTKQQSYTARIVKILPIILPPTLTEQTAIANALSDVDALLRSLGELIDKKRAVKQGAMQELLTGRRRLEGFGGEWVEKTLGEVGECLIGLTYKPENISKSGTLVLRSSNIQGNKLSFNDNVYVNSEIPEKLRTKKGDILICVRNGSRQLIGKCAKIEEKAIGETFGAFMTIFRTPNSNFIHQVFQGEKIKKQIEENLGATINQITNRVLKSFRFLSPTDDIERIAIAQILSNMDAEIAALEAKQAKYRHIKQGMMQELLTGKTRLV